MRQIDRRDLSHKLPSIVQLTGETTGAKLTSRLSQNALRVALAGVLATFNIELAVGL